MSTSPSPAHAARITSTPDRAAGVPCAARPGTSFRHPDGRCQCFVGGAPPQLAAPVPALGLAASASGRADAARPNRTSEGRAASGHGSGSDRRV